VICNMRVNGEDGILYDALYGIELQEYLIKQLGSDQKVSLVEGDIVFHGNDYLKQYLERQENIKPKVLSGEQSNTSITYGNKFFLKMYRKVDRAMNPDLELSQFLSQQGKFKSIPPFVGSIEWFYDRGSMVLGLAQEMVENSGDAWTYMLERLDNFNDRILEQPPGTTGPPPKVGSFIDPIGYESMPEQMQELLDAGIAEKARQLGIRTGEMHKALAAGQSIDFKPEEYSLHYQRSLFAGLQSLVRGTFQSQAKNLGRLNEEIRDEALEVLEMKNEILSVLKNIYKHKIDVTKIRIHGDFHLGQVIFTGRDFILTDFEGEPARSYSERRLKRSPLRDVAGMIRSFHYAAYASLFLDNQIRKSDFPKLIPYIDQWYHYISQFFMRAYLETVQGSSFIPKSKDDLLILMRTFLLEKAIYELNYEINNRPDWVVIPLRGIKTLMGKEINVNQSSAEKENIEEEVLENRS
jgi:maltose alpha-D-glucosyltransferase / alpha-amylase